MRSLWLVRLVGTVTVVTGGWYLAWAMGHLSPSALWLAVPCALASATLVACLLLTVFNNWNRAVPKPQPLPCGQEETVTVIIPTAGEPAWMVHRTATSVLEQDWPHEHLVVMVSDDAQSDDIFEATRSLAAEHPRARIIYFRPPRRGAPARRGDAKSGNLNAAVVELDRLSIRSRWIETRDADDLVGHRSFLRHCVGYLASNHNLAYVQTIKESMVTDGDPFNTLEPLFYRAIMFSRNASNSVFPCGSGLVWRRAALNHIGGFPTWNLVEDLQSGLEALRRGWQAVYLPIVGAIGQHSPEDIPSVFKQRGTWAMDTVRLMVFGDMRGLTWRQRLTFIELGLYYVQAGVLLIFAITPVLSFTVRINAFETDNISYALHLWPFMLAVESYLALLNGRHTLEALLRSRQATWGLAPVYLKGVAKAIWYGPNRKPAYVVTRKVDRFAWYWRQTLSHITIVTLLVGSLAYASFATSARQFDFGSTYWAMYFSLMLGSYVTRGWFGVRGKWRADRRRIVHPSILRGPHEDLDALWEALSAPGESSLATERRELSV